MNINIYNSTKSKINKKNERIKPEYAIMFITQNGIIENFTIRQYCFIFSKSFFFILLYKCIIVAIAKNINIIAQTIRIIMLEL
jgi:hypothetical protein